MLVGAGSYGIVHLCTDKRTGKKMVMKIIHLALEQNVQALSIIDSSKKEVELLAQLDHNNIVRYYESFFTEGKDKNSQFCIVMEYCNGGDLAQRIQANEKAQAYFNERVFEFYLTSCI